jgi:hypothetical protein
VKGLALFAVTNWLSLKGGEVAGQHLVLLGQCFIGYRVTFVGSLIGFAYAFVYGFVGAYFIAGIYNWLVTLKEGQQRAQRSGPYKALLGLRQLHNFMG